MPTNKENRVGKLRSKCVAVRKEARQVCEARYLYARWHISARYVPTTPTPYRITESSPVTDSLTVYVFLPSEQLIISIPDVMPLGRPRTRVDEARRAEARRAKVRLNVQAFRKRQKEIEERGQAEQSQSPTSSVVSITGGPHTGDHSGSIPTRRSDGTTDPVIV